MPGVAATLKSPFTSLVEPRAPDMGNSLERLDLRVAEVLVMLSTGNGCDRTRGWFGEGLRVESLNASRRGVRNAGGDI